MCGCSWLPSSSSIYLDVLSVYAEVGCFAGVGQKDEYLENELGRETSIIHSNQRGLIRRGALPLHLPRSLSKEFFYRGIWTFYAHQKRVDHPKNGTISQQLWDNITDLIQQKSRYQLAAGELTEKPGCDASLPQHHRRLAFCSDGTTRRLEAMCC